MCCFFLALVLLGPRIMGAFWWLFRPGLWNLAFKDWALVWWLWPVLGLIFLPWTTIMFVIVSPGGVTGLDWLWLGLMVAADVVSYGGGAGRRQLPGYEGY